MERDQHSQTPTLRHHSIPLDILDDLGSRFIINLPELLRNDLIRICFQMEMAHWFYSDEYVANEVKAASYKHNLRNCSMQEFSKHMFRHIPFLRKHGNNVEEILENWRQYKITVPTYGAIMLNEDLTQVLLVQSYWNKTSWGFPKGKVNEEEADHDCAVREVLEETGYSIADKIDPDQYSEVVINEQLSRLFFIPGVSMNTVFAPRTKYEIRDCQWYPLELLPSSKKDPIPDSLPLKYNSLYMVMPFVRSIRKWVASQKRRSDHRRRSTQPRTSLSLTQPTTPNPQRGQKTKAEQMAPFETMEYMPKAWMNFTFKKKDLFQAMDEVLTQK